MLQCHFGLSKPTAININHPNTSYINPQETLAENPLTRNKLLKKELH